MRNVRGRGFDEHPSGSRRAARRPPRIGVALGGGVARALAQVGVMRAWAREGLPVDCIAATSSGAIVGALWAAGLDMERMEELARNVRWLRNVIGFAFPRLGLLSSHKSSRFLRETVGVEEFAQLKIPLAVITVDLQRHEECVLTSGDLGRAVQASCSIPGIFTPVEVGGRLLVDGGVLNNLPGDVARAMGADVVVGVDVNRRARSRSPVARPDSLAQVVFHCLVMMIERNTAEKRRACDYLIEPEMDEIGYLDLDRWGELLERGEAAARPVLRALRTALLEPERCTS
ncbi:MAG: patatin-like phospholipase family protein [Deltaproteobacteria bacterium]|nr:patatin-like phospholipase family protein [Deltaproteobacteria bacterium]